MQKKPTEWGAEGHRGKMVGNTKVSIERTQLAVDIPMSLRRRIRILAAKRGVTIKSLVNDMLEYGIEEYEEFTGEDSDE